MARLGRSQPFAPLQFGAIAEVAENELSASGSISINGAAVLNATGALLAAGSASITGSADLDASGSLVAAGSLSITGAADLDAAGSLLAAGSINISGAADLDAIGNLIAAGSLSVTGTAELTGSAIDVAAAGSLSITGSAALTAVGQLLSAGSIVITGAALLDDGIEEPEPEATQKPAGRPRRKRRRYYVEIDGQEFEVSGADEAAVLLSRAREVAQTAIEKARAAPVRINHGLSRPRIKTADPELAPIVAQARREILDLYDEAIRDLEIKALMAKADEEEEEALIRLLM